MYKQVFRMLTVLYADKTYDEDIHEECQNVLVAMKAHKKRCGYIDNQLAAVLDSIMREIKRLSKQSRFKTSFKMTDLLADMVREFNT